MRNTPPTVTAAEARVIHLARRISRVGGVSTRTMAELREALGLAGIDWQRERAEWKAEVAEALQRLKDRP